MSLVRGNGGTNAAIITPLVRGDGALALVETLEMRTAPPRVIKAPRDDVMRIIAEGAVAWRGAPVAVRVRSHDIAGLLRNEPRLLHAADGSPPFRIEPLGPKLDDAYAAEPLADEVIVSQGDLPDFLARPLVPGVQAKPCRLALSPKAIAELHRYGSTTLSPGGGRRLDVIVAGSPSKLVREGGPLVQHIWTPLGAQEIDPFPGGGAEDCGRPAFWSDPIVREPVLAAVTFWRFTDDARGRSQGVETLDARLKAAFGFEPSEIVGLDALAPAPPSAGLAATAEFVLAVAKGVGVHAKEDDSPARICALAPNPNALEGAFRADAASGPSALFQRTPAAERLEALDRRFGGLSALRTSTVLGICRNMTIVELRRDDLPADLLNLGRDWQMSAAESTERPDRLERSGAYLPEGGPEKQSSA
ncbi:MAG: hypothetical protein HXY23_12085 [Parvularculaceae bacterium]|nr:hypothetical protein [Parvularculaceae bacterium]